MKTKIYVILILAAVLVYFSCKKTETPAPVTTTPAVKDNYSNTTDFFAKNAIPAQYFTVSGATGGTFTGKEGTKFTFPANAFVDVNNNSISGTVTLKLIELYNKSDMFFNGTLPVEANGYPLHSGGEFYLAGTFSGGIALLSPGKKFTALMPKNMNDSVAKAAAFVKQGDTLGFGGTWVPSAYDTLLSNATQYIWNGYEMGGGFADSGVWCNSDQAFPNSPAYGTVSINAAAADSQNVYNTYVFIVFKIKAMMHVYYDFYNNDENFTDPYAPVGYSATVVAVGVKNGTLYSSFTPITTSNGLNVNFTLQPTNTAAFETALNALN